MRSLLLTLALLPVLVQAQPWTTRVEATAWSSHWSWRDGLPLDQSEQRLELRPDLQWQAGAWQLKLKPRLALSSDEPRREAWLNEGSIGWQHGGWNVAAGRELLLWGPSLFWTLSDPLWADNGRGQPQRELAGHTLLRADYGLDSRRFLQLVYQLDHGHEAERAETEERVALARFEWSGDSASGGLVLSRREGSDLRVGAYGQWTASDALILYTDADAGPRDQPGRSGGRRLSALVGGAYTLESGHTVNLEYFHQGRGLSGEELDGLGPEARFGQPGPLRRNYLAVQLMNGEGGALGWIGRLSHGLDNDSGEAMLQLHYDVSDRWRLWGQVLGSYGGREGEFSAALERAGWLGVTLFIK